MRVRRFKVEQLAGQVRISGAEARHARTVLRMGVGDTVRLFDGQGHEADGRIESIDADGTIVVAAGAVRTRDVAGTPLYIAAAAPKGERADWMIEKCAELGACELMLLRTQRGQVEPGPAKVERWRRKAGEAAKQSGRATVMRVAALLDLRGAVDAAVARGMVLVADPREEVAALPDVLDTLTDADKSLSAITVFVGPEGGFDDDELGLMQRAGAVPVRLCDGILRVETAAVVAAGIWAAWSQKRGPA